MKRGDPGRGPDRLLVPRSGESARRGDLEIDTGGDCFELADALAKVRHLNPAGSGGQAAVGRVVRQLEPFQLQPTIPGLEACDARRRQSGENACRENANRQRVHHFSSWGSRSFSISRASSSFWLWM